MIYINLSDAKSNLPLSACVDTIRSVKLKLPKPYFFGIVTEVLSTDSSYYLVDEKQCVVFQFSKDGTFLNTIGTRGQGPGEISGMSSFFLGDSCAYICDLGVRKIYSYTSDGRFIKENSFPYSLIFDNIVALPHGRFLCHRMSNDEGDNKGLWVMNEQGQKIKQLISYPPCAYVYSDWNTLYTGKKGVIEIHNPMNGKYYSMNTSNDSLVEIMQQQIDMKTLVDFKDADNTRNIKEDYAYSPFVINGNHSIFSLWMLSDNKIACSVYSKESKRLKVGKFFDMDIPGYTQFGTPISSNIPNTLTTIMTDEVPLDHFPEQYQELDIDERVAILNFMELN